MKAKPTNIQTDATTAHNLRQTARAAGFRPRDFVRVLLRAWEALDDDARGEAVKAAWKKR